MGIVGVMVLVLVGVFGGTTVAAILSDRRSGFAGQSARRASLRRELMQMPATPIAAVKNGEKVRLAGRVVARGPLRKAPLSQIQCVGFSLSVGTMRGSGLFDQEEFDSFGLSDGTGEAVVHAPFRVELDPYDAREENAPQALYDLLKQAGAPVTTFGRQDGLRYIETLLRPGDEIIAVGRATVEIDPAGRAPSHREPPVICHLKGTDEPVIIADAEEA